MIDLSQFVDKKVRVTFRNGEMRDCDIKFYPIRTATYPYIISYVIGNKRNETSYTRWGRLDLNTSTSPGDIIKIEELKPMNKYEELENKVAEMQKEIDRLKREEKKENYPNLKPMEVTRTVRFTPEEYFEHCEENGFEPSEEGYVEYYSDAYTLEDCFMCREHHTQQIKTSYSTNQRGGELK
jgi:hypothetical protein